MTRDTVLRHADTAVADRGPTASRASIAVPAAIMASWAAMFWWLWLTGRRALFLSPRTSWVVPMAAILLTMGTAGYLLASRGRVGGPLTRANAWSAAALLAPVLLIVAMPAATLGASSSDRAAFAGAGSSIAAIATGELTLVDVATAQSLPGGMHALAARAGEPVDFTGVVTRYPDTPADELILTRYVVTCCVADATVTQIRVVNVVPGRFGAESWVRVEGTIYPVGQEVLVDASSVTEVPTPEQPYLSP